MEPGELVWNAQRIPKRTTMRIVFVSFYVIFGFSICLFRLQWWRRERAREIWRRHIELTAKRMGTENDSMRVRDKISILKMSNTHRALVDLVLFFVCFYHSEWLNHTLELFYHHLYATLIVPDRMRWSRTCVCARVSIGVCITMIEQKNWVVWSCLLCRMKRINRLIVCLSNGFRLLGSFMCFLFLSSSLSRSNSLRKSVFFYSFIFNRLCRRYDRCLVYQHLIPRFQFKTHIDESLSHRRCVNVFVFMKFYNWHCRLCMCVCLASISMYHTFIEIGVPKCMFDRHITVDRIGKARHWRGVVVGEKNDYFWNWKTLRMSSKCISRLIWFDRSDLIESNDFQWWCEW